MIGIGLNVNSTPVLNTAVSVKNIINKEIDRNWILSIIIRKLFENLSLIQANDFENVFYRWKSNLGWLGKEIRLETGKEVITGILKDINNDGAAVISSRGYERVFYTGDLIS